MLKGEEIIHLEVFERDEWTCGLCQKAIDRWRRGQDWMRATLDHILPLSEGGLHTYDNVQAAHWLCNVSKSGACPKAVAGRLTGPNGQGMIVA